MTAVSLLNETWNKQTQTRDLVVLACVWTILEVAVQCVAAVSNQSPCSDQWSEAFNYGLNNVSYSLVCTLFPK